MEGSFKQAYSQPVTPLRADYLVIGFASLFSGLLASLCQDLSHNFRTSEQTSPRVVVSYLPSHLMRSIDKRSAELTHLVKGRNFLAQLRPLLSQANTTSIEQAMALDQEWQSSDHELPWIRDITNNSCSEILRDLRLSDPAFAEIFITDNRGLNICQSNKTSDFYQADEVWWQESFKLGRGQHSYGHIEWDESAGMEAVPLYLAIYSKHSKDPIAIIKAVLNLTRILAES